MEPSVIAHPSLRTDRSQSISVTIVVNGRSRREGPQRARGVETASLTAVVLADGEEGLSTAPARHELLHRPGTRWNREVTLMRGFGNGVVIAALAAATVAALLAMLSGVRASGAGKSASRPSWRTG